MTKKHKQYTQEEVEAAFRHFDNTLETLLGFYYGLTAGVAAMIETHPNPFALEKAFPVVAETMKKRAKDKGPIWMHGFESTAVEMGMAIKAQADLARKAFSEGMDRAATGRGSNSIQ